MATSTTQVRAITQIDQDLQRLSRQRANANPIIILLIDQQIDELLDERLQLDSERRAA